MKPPKPGSDKQWEGVERRRGEVNPFRVAIILERELSDAGSPHAVPECAPPPGPPADAVPGGG